MADMGLFEYRALPVRVIDGDTVVVLCDTGFRGRYEPVIRLAGVQAPKLGTAEGLEAKHAASAWMDSTLELFSHLKWPLWVKTYSTKREEPDQLRTFERWPGEVWSFDRSRYLNVFMLDFILNQRRAKEET